MTWSLVRECGIGKGRVSGNRGHQCLSFPTRAARAEDGSYLISEEQGIEKLVPFRFECRTIRVDADHTVLFDSTDHGIDDGFGCLMEDGYIGILRRTKWELLIVSPQGAIVDQLSLECFSKRIPRFAVWTKRGTFLIVFYNRSFEVDIVEVDRRGRLLWFLPASVKSIGIAGSAELLPTNNILVADPFRHVVIEVDRDGQTVWQYGVAGCPSARNSHLSSPNSARNSAGECRLIADTRNHRILRLGPDGVGRAMELGEQSLCDPMYAEELLDRHVLICDTGNSRVVEFGEDGRMVWEFGRPVASPRLLSYPRSVQMVGSDRYLVADTGHDRVVRLGEEGIDRCLLHAEGSLFWPRCVRPLADGGLLIADSRNGRVVEVSPEGIERRQVSALRGNLELEDPHDVHLLPNGHLLIADSPKNLILEIDWSGTIYRTIGDDDALRLKDPHSAQPLPDGMVLVADTGNHRVLFVSPEGNCITELRQISSESCCFRLHHPRYVELSRDGILIVCDTGNNRVLAATPAGKFLWEFSLVPTPSLTRLNQPRWATLVKPDELLVCDHFHHRVLHVRRDPEAF